jgi:hypothetical protein
MRGVVARIHVAYMRSHGGDSRIWDVPCIPTRDGGDTRYGMRGAYAWETLQKVASGDWGEQFDMGNAGLNARPRCRRLGIVSMV